MSSWQMSIQTTALQGKLFRAMLFLALNKNYKRRQLNKDFRSNVCQQADLLSNLRKARMRRYRWTRREAIEWMDSRRILISPILTWCWFTTEVLVHNSWQTRTTFTNSLLCWCAWVPARRREDKGDGKTRRCGKLRGRKTGKRSLNVTSTLGSPLG